MPLRRELQMSCQNIIWSPSLPLPLSLEMLIRSSSSLSMLFSRANKIGYGSVLLPSLTQSHQRVVLQRVCLANRKTTRLMQSLKRQSLRRRGASEKDTQEEKSKPQEEGETFATISGRRYSHADEDDTRALLLKPLVGHESILYGIVETARGDDLHDRARANTIVSAIFYIMHLI